MSARKSMRSSVLLSIVLAVLLLFLALRGVDWQDMLAVAHRGHLDQLFVSTLLLAATYIMRALRWRVLIRAESQIGLLRVFWATTVGYLGNSFLPARAGELLRSMLLARRAAISTSFVLATALTERIMDAMALALIGATASLNLQGMPDWLPGAARAVMAVGTLSIIGLGIVSHAEHVLRRGLHRLALPTRFQTRVDALLRDFLRGLRALQHPGRAVSFIGLTAAIWLVDAVWVIIAAKGLDLPLTLPQALLLLVTLGLASAVPSTPGYIGIYQFVAVTVLIPFGYSRDQAIVFIVAVQAETYVTVLICGLLGLWQLTRTVEHSATIPGG